jgi:hypothetical protein
MAECMAARERLDEAGARELVGWIGNVRCYGLTFSSLDEAVALIKETAPVEESAQ